MKHMDGYRGEIDKSRKFCKVLPFSFFLRWQLTAENDCCCSSHHTEKGSVDWAFLCNNHFELFQSCLFTKKSLKNFKWLKRRWLLDRATRMTMKEYFATTTDVDFRPAPMYANQSKIVNRKRNVVFTFNWWTCSGSLNVNKSDFQLLMSSKH